MAIMCTSCLSVLRSWATLNLNYVKSLLPPSLTLVVRKRRLHCLPNFRHVAVRQLPPSDCQVVIEKDVVLNFDAGQFVAFLTPNAPKSVRLSTVLVASLIVQIIIQKTVSLFAPTGMTLSSNSSSQLILIHPNGLPHLLITHLECLPSRNASGLEIWIQSKQRENTDRQVSRY